MIMNIFLLRIQLIHMFILCYIQFISNKYYIFSFTQETINLKFHYAFDWHILLLITSIILQPSTSIQTQLIFNSSYVVIVVRVITTHRGL